MQAYSRTQAVLGKDAVEKLSHSKVLIAGLGGVGGYSLEALARMGVENFILVDCDVFEESNLNRQILCIDSNIGQSKCIAAKERVIAINPDAAVTTFDTFIDESNTDIILSENPDVVVDAIDSVPSKCMLLIKCIKRGIPVVSSMGAAMKTDPLLVRTGDISETYGCPLAKKVRSFLKASGIVNGIECVFSPEKTDIPYSGVLGSLPTVVGTFGLVLAKLASECINRSYTID